MTRLMNISRTKEERSVSGRGLPSFASCLSRCVRPGLSPKGHVTASSCNQSLDRPERDDRMDTGYWIQDKFGLLKLHIRRNRLSKLSGFKSHARGASASTASAHNISRASSHTDSMEISMQSTDTTLHPQ